MLASYTTLRIIYIEFSLIKKAVASYRNWLLKESFASNICERYVFQECEQVLRFTAEHRTKDAGDPPSKWTLARGHWSGRHDLN